MSTDTFGARLAAAPAAEQFSLHVAEGNRREFTDYDRVLASLFDRAIRGASIVDLKFAGARTETDVVALRISDDDRDVLAHMLAPDTQQARGGWYLPETDKLQVG